jgi:hypothetical protein
VGIGEKPIAPASVEGEGHAKWLCAARRGNGERLTAQLQLPAKRTPLAKRDVVRQILPRPANATLDRQERSKEKARHDR